MNTYNSQPIRIDTSFTSWRNSQTLNTGTIPGYSAPRQWGIRPVKVVWTNPGDDASFIITDPNDGTALLQGDTPTGFIGPDPQFDISPAVMWRDFSVTINGGTLLIFYRS